MSTPEDPDVSHPRVRDEAMTPPRRRGEGPATIRELVVSYVTRPSDDSRLGRPIHNPTEAGWLFRFLETAAQEELWVACLNAQNVVQAIHRAAMGVISTCPAPVANVLRAALLTNCPRLILCHNHPSGDPRPSSHDLVFTAQVARAARLVEVELLDHLIIGLGGVTSLKATGALPSS